MRRAIAMGAAAAICAAAGADKIVTVRLVNKKTGKPVPDAVIFASRLDMTPDGMQEMVTKVTPMPSHSAASFV